MLPRKQKEQEKTLFELARGGKIKIGDTLPYKPQEARSYCISKEKSGTTKDQWFHSDSVMNEEWIILDPLSMLGNQHSVKITTKNPVYQVKFGGASPYLYGHQELTHLSKMLGTRKEVLSATTMTMADINNLLCVNVDCKRKIVYQANNPDTDINFFKNFMQEIREKDGFLEFFDEIGEKTAICNTYCYNVKEMEVNEKIKKIVDTSDPYWIDSKGIDMYSNRIGAGIGAFFNGFIQNSYTLFRSEKIPSEVTFGIRPILYIDGNLTLSD